MHLQQAMPVTKRLPWLFIGVKSYIVLASTAASYQNVRLTVAQIKLLRIMPSPNNSSPGKKTQAEWVHVGDVNALASSGRLHACVQVGLVLCCTPDNAPWVVAGMHGIRGLENDFADDNNLVRPFCIFQGRYVSVLRIKGRLTCIDSICFHAGGPLVSRLLFRSGC